MLEFRKIDKVDRVAAATGSYATTRSRRYRGANALSKDRACLPSSARLPDRANGVERSMDRVIKLRTGGAIALFAVLCGCATLTPDECQYADWRTIGYEDGIQGRHLGVLSKHREACAKVGVTPDLDAYQAGRMEGIRVFCQPANAYQQGRQGYSYAGICPADMERAFLVAHGEGMAIFNLESAVEETVAAIAYLNGTIENAERRIAKANIALDENKELTGERRRRIRDDIRDISRDIGRMEVERDRLLVELGAREARLRDHVGAHGY